MAFYPEPQYNVYRQVPFVAGNFASPIALGTTTYAGTGANTFTGTAGTTVNGAFRFPIFKYPIVLTGVRVYCTTAAATNVTGVNLGFYNGTTLMGVASNVGTVGFIDAVMVSPTVASNGAQTGGNLMTNTSSNEVLLVSTATGTASALTMGTYVVDFIVKDLFTT